MVDFTLRVVVYFVAAFLVTISIQSVTNAKFENLKEGKGLRSQDIATIQERERQLSCLAINIYKEAGYEPFEGKVAVAQVTMNRVKSSDFPDDVCAVVYQKTTGVKVVCQFSWYCDRVHKNRPVNPEAYTESYAVAKKVLLEGFKLDILKDALYYHATYVKPGWKFEKIGTIGQHIFYKPRKESYAAL